MNDTYIHTEPVGLILAGGRSMRMGGEKAGLRLHGECQAVHLWMMLSSVCRQSFLSVRPGQADGTPWERIPRIEDMLPSMGPITGIISAAARFPRRPILVTAVDMPDLDTPMLEKLLKKRDPRMYATVPYNPRTGRIEPLFAVYEPAAIQALARAFRMGRYSITDIIRDMVCRFFPITEAGEPGNINTRQELREYMKERV